MQNTTPHYAHKQYSKSHSRPVNHADGYARYLRDRQQLEIIWRRQGVDLQHARGELAARMQFAINVS